MQQCPLCNKFFKQLAKHARKMHNLSPENCVTLTQFNGVPPKCICGLCDEKPLFNRGKFSKYALGHEKFEVREVLYIKKYGSPQCFHCGTVVKFFRGNPKQFCSLICSGLHNGGFTQLETQNKIKQIVIEKYGVNNVSQITEVKQKISVAKTGKEGWRPTDERKQEISKFTTKLWKDPAFRKNFTTKLSIVRKKNWQDPVYRKTILEGNLSGKHSKLHKKISKYLGLENLDFESEKVIFRYRVDEIHFEKKIIIEINGDYIHANPNKFKADDLIIVRSSQYLAQNKWNYDQKRKEALESLGFKIFVIWESDDLDKKNWNYTNYLVSDINESHSTSKL